MSWTRNEPLFVTNVAVGTSASSVGKAPLYEAGLPLVVSSLALGPRGELGHERSSIGDREPADEVLADIGGGAVLDPHAVPEELDRLEGGAILRRRDREDVVRQEARRGDLGGEGAGALVIEVADDRHLAGGGEIQVQRT
jgi:hypothetical protein